MLIDHHVVRTTSRFCRMPRSTLLKPKVLNNRALPQDLEILVLGLRSLSQHSLSVLLLPIAVFPNVGEVVHSFCQIVI